MRRCAACSTWSSGPASSAAGVAPAPYASGLASTTEEERRLGIVCIDMGAGATTLSVFAADRLRLVDTVAVGGQHVTFDIARALSTPFDQAERIKTLYGTLDSAASEDQGMVAYTLTGEEEPTLYQTTKARIQGIVRNRVTDLLAHVAERVERSGVGQLAAHGVVLTGGGSQLPGLSKMAEGILARPVRIAHCSRWPACRRTGAARCFRRQSASPRSRSTPALECARSGAPAHSEQPGYLERVGQWLRKGF